jgi:hypothetical protein
VGVGVGALNDASLGVSGVLKYEHPTAEVEKGDLPGNHREISKRRLLKLLGEARQFVRL